MLSIENQPPPDPPFPQVNSCSNSDEKVAAADSLNKLPNFSIRDYVFTSRSNDIKKNWPFSLKSLQLCLKHGVKDVLPPFQPLDTVKNYLSIERIKVETTSLERENTISFDKEPPKPDHHVDVAQSHVKLAESHVELSSCGSQEKNDFPSATTSISQSDIEFVSHNRQSSSPLESETFLKPSVEIEATGPPVTTHKTRNTFKPSSKKCRLIVKFGGNSERSSAEDIASNCTSLSESMASKVCPVCKTFSSSSNTKLNAHIDQCLSVGSTPKWTADSKITRHRIKPRKTRLMVDIYETAPCCTLEELDRRNGRSWATVSTLPLREAEKIASSDKGKKQRLSLDNPEDAGDVGPVYIDANGTKVRILSKFNDSLPVSIVEEDNEARKPLREGKGCKYISKKKKRLLAQKHRRYSKVTPPSRKILSHKTRGPQISEGREGYNGVQNSCNKEHQTSKQIKPSDCGTLTPWVCSKRRDFTKRITSQERHDELCKWHLPQDLLVDNARSVLNDSPSGVNSVPRFTNLSQNLTFPLRENERRVEKLSRTDQVNNKMERSLQKIKRKISRLRKDGAFSVMDRQMLRPPNSIGNHVSSPSKNKVNIQGDTIKNTDIAPFASKKSYRSSRAIVTKAMKFSSLRKNVLSVTNRASVTESGHGNIKKRSVHTNSKGYFMAERDEGLMVRDSGVNQQSALMCDHNENEFEREETTDQEMMPLERSVIQKSFQERELLSVSQKDKDFILNNSPKVHSNSLQSVENYGGFLCGGSEALTGTLEPDFMNDDDMFPTDEVSNGMVGRNYFPMIDPIPIPGPPGSFLPSPRDMGSEDFQGNSSLTTSRVHSSRDQHDAINRNSSNSPISAESTISNSTHGNSDFRYSESSSAVRLCAAEGNVTPGLMAASVVLQPTSTEGERTVLGGEYPKLDGISAEMGSLSFKNDQPCCCQRKERFFQGVALNSPESSQLLKRRKMAPAMVPALAKRANCNVNPRPPPELASRSSGITSVSEKVVVPVFKPPEGPLPCKDSPNAGARLEAPILRLMGKNLMVVNKEEEDASTRFGQVEPCDRNKQQIALCPTFSHLPQGSDIFSRDPCAVTGQHFDIMSSNSFRRHQDPKIPRVNVELPPGMLQDQQKGGYYFQLPMYNAENFSLCLDSYDLPVKETIVINDFPKKETAMTNDIAARYTGECGSGISIPVPPDCNLDRVHPLFRYHSREHPPFDESPMVSDATFRTASTAPRKATPVMWVCTPSEGSVSRARIPIAESTSAYYSSSFS